MSHSGSTLLPGVRRLMMRYGKFDQIPEGELRSLMDGVPVEAASEFGCRRLWLSVLATAMIEAEYRGPHREQRAVARRTRRWIESHAKDIGSFSWICSALGLNQRMLREKLFPNQKETMAHDPTDPDKTHPARQSD